MVALPSHYHRLFFGRGQVIGYSKLTLKLVIPKSIRNHFYYIFICIRRNFSIDFCGSIIGDNNSLENQYISYLSKIITDQDRQPG